MAAKARIILHYSKNQTEVLGSILPNHVLKSRPASEFSAHFSESLLQGFAPSQLGLALQLGRQRRLCSQVPPRRPVSERVLTVTESSGGLGVRVASRGLLSLLGLSGLLGLLGR